MLYLRFSSNEIPRCVIARESNILMSISLASPAHKIVIHNFSLIREFTHVLTKNKKIYFYVAREACKWANTSPNKLWLLLLFHASLIRFRLFQWIARWRPIHPHYNLLFFNSNDESFIESRWGQPLNDEGRKSDFSTFFYQTQRQEQWNNKSECVAISSAHHTQLKWIYVGANRSQAEHSNEIYRLLTHIIFAFMSGLCLLVGDRFEMW